MQKKQNKTVSLFRALMLSLRGAQVLIKKLRCRREERPPAVFWLAPWHDQPLPFHHPPVQGGMRVGGGVSEIALILGCILSSARVHRRVSLPNGFIHSVVVCRTCLLSPTSHKKTQSHLSGGHSSQLSCVENQQRFWESQLDGWQF